MKNIEELNKLLAPGIRVEEQTPYCLVFRHLYQDKILLTLYSEDFSKLKVSNGIKI